MKDILFISELYYPSIGGQEIRFKEFAEELVCRGYDVTVITIDHLGVLEKQQIINGVTVNRICGFSNYVKKSGGRNVWAIFIFTIKLILHCRKKNYKFIYINQWPILPALLPYFLNNNTNYKIDFIEYRNSIFWRIINYAIAIINRGNLIFISDSVANKMPFENHLVIPSLVKLRKYTSSRKDKFIFVGRLEEHKRPQLAIDSFLAWSKDHDDCYSFHVVGDGVLLNKLKERYWGNEKIIFHGFVSDDYKNTLLSESKVLILPSEREGLPKTVIEAIASQTPVITTSDKGNFTKYFVDEKKVGRVSEANEYSISNAINNIIENYGFYQEQCRIVAPEHDLSRAVDQMERIINE